MPWIISPFNGAVIQVTDTSPLLKNARIVSAPGTTVAPANPQQIVSSNAVSTVMSDQDKRRKVVEGTIFSTIPAVAAIQKQAQAEYIATGKWNSVYEKQAEAIRKGLNPMYAGGDKGFTDAQYFLQGAGAPDPSLNGISGMFEGLFGLFGQGAAGVGQGAGKVGDAATGSSTNGTFMLAIGAVLLFVLMGRR